MKTAIIGLPMTGKTSLFTILTGVQSETRIGSTAARTGVARVPDARLEALGRLFEPPKVTHATVEYVDMPSISKENLRDPSYLASLRVVDAFAHVLRLFADETVPHEKGSVDPLRDMEDVETELILSDLVVVEKRLERLEKDRKKIKNPELDREFELLEKCKAVARSEPAAAPDGSRSRRRKAPAGIPVSLAEAHALRAESGRKRRRANCTNANGNIARARSPAGKHTAASAVCGKIEAELSELPAAEQRDYLASYGLEESGLERLISATYSLLGLMSFLTAGEDECRAWTIPIHTPAVKAAGAIHSDFEKKFIRAEVVNWKALVDHGGYAGVREKGLLRLEGKEYIVKDGDVLVIRHS